MRTATAIAVSMFNDGASSLGLILEELGLEVHTFAKDLFKRTDFTRIITAQRQSLHATNENRRRMRLHSLGRDEQDAEREGFPYLAGAH